MCDLELYYLLFELMDLLFYSYKSSRLIIREWYVYDLIKSLFFLKKKQPR